MLPTDFPLVRQIIVCAAYLRPLQQPNALSCYRESNRVAESRIAVSLATVNLSKNCAPLISGQMMSVSEAKRDLL